MNETQDTDFEEKVKQESRRTLHMSQIKSM